MEQKKIEAKAVNQAVENAIEKVVAQETKPVVKKGAKKPAQKKVEKKATEKQVKEVKNEEKKNTFITIQEVTKLYSELGIKCTNPNAKGNYRIMGSKSSLNVLPTKGYYIYSCDADYDLVTEAGLKFEDLVIEKKGSNSRDHARPNTIICTALETLKAVLAVYAKNEANAIKVEKPEVPAVIAQ